MRTPIHRVMNPEVGDLWWITRRDKFMSPTWVLDDFPDKEYVRRVSSVRPDIITLVKDEVEEEGIISIVATYDIDRTLEYYSPYLSTGDSSLKQCSCLLHLYLNSESIFEIHKILLELNI